MQEFRKDEIVYDEQWHSFDTPTIIDSQSDNVKTESNDIEDESQVTVNKTKKPKKIALITIQLVICLLIAFLIFILKSMDSDFFTQFSRWYNNAMRNTLVSNSSFEDVDLSDYFSSTIDSSTATKDEV